MTPDERCRRAHSIADLMVGESLEDAFAVIAGAAAAMLVSIEDHNTRACLFASLVTAIVQGLPEP